MYCARKGCSSVMSLLLYYSKSVLTEPVSETPEISSFFEGIQHNSNNVPPHLFSLLQFFSNIETENFILQLAQ